MISFRYMSTALLVAVLTGCKAEVGQRTDSAISVDSVTTNDVPGDSARGLALMNYFRDSVPDHSGNELRCTSCHLDGGLRASSMPWIGSFAGYPRYRARSASIETMPMRINDCIARSLAGKVLPDSSRDMQDMIAYLASIGKEKRPSGVDTVRVAGRVSAGAHGYVASCARCHGANGEGTVLAPAAWGADSYSVGAGMARQKMLATFLRHNMPFDMPGTLTDQEAADIAAYMLTQPRQDYPGKERDWPKGDAPADVAYATDGARNAGKPVPADRPVLPRRVAPGN